MDITAYQLAERFAGIREVAGASANAHILAMLRLDSSWPTDDETPWCSAFVNYIAWLLRLPRSKSLAARSWLGVGRPVSPEMASVGFDVVILERGAVGGHVGFFSSMNPDQVFLLGGNQGDSVCVAPFARSRILGVRRLA